jgi:hypothetical protein
VRFLVYPSVAARARAPVRAFLLFAALALAGFAAQRVLAGGLTPAGVEALYLGPGGEEPLAAVALWEELHAGAFVYGFVLFMLGSLAAASPVRSGPRRVLFAGALAATLADLAAPFVVSAAQGVGALRVATFVLAVGFLAALLGVVAVGAARTGGHVRG